MWCPDWSVTAAGHGQDEPVAVIADGWVRVCSKTARDEGVRPGMRRRQAESRCVGLLVLEHDPVEDVRAFEPVAAAVETVVPAVEVLQPGLCACPARGPARYYGSEEQSVQHMREVVASITGVAPGVGIADGLFAATQAARLERIVLPGEHRAFLGELPVNVLDAPDLADRFRRLGLLTLGDVAALTVGAMTERFGVEGARAHRLACGLDDLPLRLRKPPPDLAVETAFDPPATGLDTLLFAARQLSVELATRLEERVLGCTLLAIEARMANDHTLVRRWRHEDGLSSDALVERVRWQVEAWLRQTARQSGADADVGPVDEGVTHLRLVPELVRPERGRQLGFWGATPADALVARTLVRVQGMLGADAVMRAVVQGGRTPAAQARLIAWDEAGSDTDPGSNRAGGRRRPRRTPRIVEPPPPWPGRIPPPAPATAYAVPPAVTVVDAAGLPVTVVDRGALSAEPASARVLGASPVEVLAWAGPWQADERWWDVRNCSRRTRLQVVLDDGSAHLLAFERERWLLEATYD